MPNPRETRTSRKEAMAADGAAESGAEAMPQVGFKVGDGRESPAPRQKRD